MDPTVKEKLVEKISANKSSKNPKSNELQLNSQLHEILPKNYLYKVFAFTFDGPTAFTTTFKVNLDTPDEIDDWLAKFYASSKCKFNIKFTKPCSGRLRKFKKSFKCQFNVSGGVLGRGKHFGCPALLNITLYSVPVNKTYPTEIIIKWHHNHSILPPELIPKQQRNRKRKLELSINKQNMTNNTQSNPYLDAYNADLLEHYIFNIDNILSTVIFPMARRNANKFLPPLKHFFEILSNLKTQKEMISSIKTFGKNDKLAEKSIVDKTSSEKPKLLVTEKLKNVSKKKKFIPSKEGIVANNSCQIIQRNVVTNSLGHEYFML